MLRVRSCLIAVCDRTSIALLLRASFVTSWASNVAINVSPAPIVSIKVEIDGLGATQYAVHVQIAQQDVRCGHGAIPFIPLLPQNPNFFMGYDAEIV